MLSYKPLIEKITNFILDDGYTSYSKLDDDQQCELAELCLQAYGNSAYEAVVEHDKFDNVICLLQTYLKMPSVDNAVDLAEQLRRNTNDYFADRLSEMFADIYNEIKCERNREEGLHPVTDHVNGEIRWVR